MIVKADMEDAKLAGEQAAALAKKLLSAELPGDAMRVSRAYEILYARPATKAESDRAMSHVASATASLDSIGDANAKRQTAWTSLCRVLMAANEFVYVN